MPKDSTRRTKCPICPKTVSRSSDLGRHLKSHDPNSRQFKCEWLGCTFEGRQKSNLEIHINSVHTKEMTYTCQDCGRISPDPATFSRHKKKCLSQSSTHRIVQALRSANAAASPTQVHRPLPSPSTATTSSFPTPTEATPAHLPVDNIAYPQTPLDAFVPTELSLGSDLSFLNPLLFDGQHDANEFVSDRSCAQDLTLLMASTVDQKVGDITQVNTCLPLFDTFPGSYPLQLKTFPAQSSLYPPLIDSCDALRSMPPASVVESLVPTLSALPPAPELYLSEPMSQWQFPQQQQFLPTLDVYGPLYDTSTYSYQEPSTSISSEQWDGFNLAPESMPTNEEFFAQILAGSVSSNPSQVL
ncbi:hypothetical protein AX16_000783 [Volvariella volvacea WC 439]|nr:hypothetical protein AX16_000783 [Volvariella volvacea WC 439]